jgi:6-phosphogluconolactonase/Glucosamine-6-phosphate isomerase/deaminase
VEQSDRGEVFQKNVNNYNLYMQKLQFNANVSAEIISFKDYSSLAQSTLPFAQKGFIALSGGSTYSRLFPFWVALKPDCAHASFFPVDERIIDFDDPQSNWGAAYKNFLVPMKKEVDKSNFAQSADQYFSILKSKFNSNFPIFDVIFLGVGDDGHTASLFPGYSYLNDKSSVVLETTSPKPPFSRVTLGMGPIISSKKVIAILSGKDKLAVAKKIFEKDIDLPIVKVLSQRECSTVFIEEPIMKKL